MTHKGDQTTEIDSPVPVGTVVDGYRVERIISVREGLDTLADATGPSGERVTLKLLAAPLEGKDVRRRVAKLAMLQASIAHPHVLPLIGNGERREHLCLSGAPMNATTLADRLRGGPLDPKQTVTLLSQLAGALETARRRGLVHRALSPEAIVVTGDDPPTGFLTDFGIAVPDVPGCRLEGAVEDADYRSPEEVRGEAPTPESTVYSLACVLVACLTGAPPYPYHRPLLALHAHLVEPPPRVTERNPDLPSELDAVVARAMDKDPRERFGSPVAFMRAVQRAVGVEAPMPGPSAPKRQEAQRGAKRDARAPARRPTHEPDVRPAREREVTRRPAREPKVTRRPAREPEVARRPAKEPKATRRPAQEPKATRPPTPEPQAAQQHESPRAPAKPPRRARRGEERRRRARPGGWAAVRRLAPTWAGIALVASALAGFAAGNGRSDERKPVDTGASAPATAERTSRPAADSTKPVVGPVVERLDQRRAAARRRLRAARLPAGQKAVANDLAVIYGDARRSILRAPGTVSSEDRLADNLRRVERAYRRLAAAARGGSGAWRRATAEVLERERDLELLLRTHSWT
jgi:hypothetical protein